MDSNNAPDNPVDTFRKFLGKKNFKDDCSQLIIAQLYIENLVQNYSKDNDENEAINKSMVFLERLTESSCPAACAFMSQLYFLADKNQMHDVCNAIDIWIQSCDSADLHNYLKTLADSPAGADIREHILSYWL